MTQSINVQTHVDNTMDFENKSLFGPVKEGCVSSPKYPAKSNGRRI